MSHIRQFLTMHPLSPEMDLELIHECENVENAFTTMYWWYMLDEDAPCGDGTMQDFIKQGLSEEDFAFTYEHLDAFEAMMVDCPITNAAFQEWMRNR